MTLRSRYLDALEPIIVKPTVACAIGFNKAAIVQQIEYWIERFRFDPEHQHDGFTWVFNSYEEWQKDNFPFWSVDTVRRLFQDLEKDGIIVSGRFNRKNYDRTKWYRLDYVKLDSLIETFIDERDQAEAQKARPSGEIAGSMGAKCPDGTGQNAPMHGGNLPRPIPETTRDYSDTTAASATPPAKVPDAGKRKRSGGQLKLRPRSRDRDPDKPLSDRIQQTWDHLRRLPHPEHSATLPRLRQLLATDEGRKIAAAKGIDLSGLLVNRSA